ncbi:hypothetical protein [Brevibacterium marinum]|uniref:Uncharacterized protein n=1 Tax=Brevibacterium marinum TaxID=418643 RepID=A0A846S4I5_9MICO|nr:hypothetical protein [Brevibacterium marinum]NJC57001.1 hypothetical protein [Brevibacterium marinum]
MRIIGKKLATVVATAALTAGSLGAVVGPAQASTDSAVAEQGSCSKAESSRNSTNMKQITGNSAEGLIRTVSNGVDDGTFNSRAGSSELDFGKGKVYKVSSGDDQFTSVTIPVDGKYATTSNLTVLFDDDGNRVNYSEVLYTHGAEGKFHLAKYENGKVTEDRDTDIPYKTDSQISQESKQGAPGEVASQKSTGDKVACVASVLGVSGTVGYLIVGACAGACAASETGVTIPVCVACIGAYATVGGASVTAVASCFN